MTAINNPYYSGEAVGRKADEAADLFRHVADDSLPAALVLLANLVEEQAQATRGDLEARRLLMNLADVLGEAGVKLGFRCGCGGHCGDCDRTEEAA